MSPTLIARRVAWCLLAIFCTLGPANAARGDDKIKQVDQLNNLPLRTYVITFDQSGKRLATVDSRSIRVWDIQSKKQEVEIKLDPKERAMRLYFSKDGQQLLAPASGNSDTEAALRTWDLATGNRVPSKFSYESVRQATFSADWKTVAIWTLPQRANNAKLFDVVTNKELATLPSVTTGWIDLSPDGKTVYMAFVWRVPASTNGSFGVSGDNPILWDIQAKQFTDLKNSNILTFNNQYSGFSPDGAYYALGYGGPNRKFPSHDYSTVMIWDVRNRKPKTKFPVQNRIDGFAFSPDSKVFAACDFSGRVTFVEVATGRILARIKEGVVSQPIAFSPDGKFFVAPSRLNNNPGNTILFFDATTLLKE